MTHLPSRTDILIVCGGPAGLSLAIALRQRGIVPLVLEKQTEAPNTSRAAVIHARTLEMLEALGVTSSLLERGVPVPIFRIRDRDRALMKVDFSGLETSYPFILMCPQDRTEAVPRDRLAAVNGSITRGADVVAVRQSKGGAAVSVRTSEDTQEVSAQWVIGCDGGHSLVREAAGIAFEGQAYEQVFVLADVRMDWPLPRDEVSLFFSPNGLAVIAPLPDDQFRIVATVDQAPEHPDEDLMRKLLAERGPIGGDGRIREIVWSSRFHLAHKIAKQIVKGQTILCGDAAHVHSPAGGQGMNIGIQDAVSLAKPLSESLRTGATDGMQNWAERRHRIAQEVVTLTDRLTRAATLRPSVGRLFRNTALMIAGHVPGVPEMVAGRLAGLGQR